MPKLPPGKGALVYMYVLYAYVYMGPYVVILYMYVYVCATSAHDNSLLYDKNPIKTV